MTTNSPNPVDGDVQALIEYCECEIEKFKRCVAQYPDAPVLRSDLKLHEIALAALTAEPVYQLIDDGKWYDAPKYLFDEANQRGDESRIVYTAPPAQLLRQVELPEFVYDPEGEPFLHRDEVVELLSSLGHEVKS